MRFCGLPVDSAQQQIPGEGRQHFPLQTAGRQVSQNGLRLLLIFTISIDEQVEPLFENRAAQIEFIAIAREGRLARGKRIPGVGDRVSRAENKSSMKRITSGLSFWRLVVSI